MKETSRGNEFLYTFWTNNLESMPNNWVNENVEENGLMEEGEEIKENDLKKVKTKLIITEKKEKMVKVKKRFKVC